MARQGWMALLLVCWVGVAVASGPAEVRKQIESTLLVKGTIDMDAQGRVERYSIEHRETLPPSIVGLIARVVPQWRFEPVQVDGRASAARTNMSLRLVAKKLDSGDFTVEIRGAQFYAAQPEARFGKGRLAPPHYPEDAAFAGVGGTAYIVLKVARDGRVEEAIAEQVNLRIVASERDMARFRKMFADAALKAAKRWTFTPPTVGEGVDEPFWSARVPVDFIAPNRREVKDHEWNAYVPGPRQAIPWIAHSFGLPAADALAAGGVYPLNAGPRLLSALDPS